MPSTASVPVYLNVYDLTPINGYTYWVGLGVYHSGVQVYEVEYAFGAHDNPTTGIFEGEPRECPAFRFRRSVLVGKTRLGPREVRSVMRKLAESYTGDSYHLISKNCNHFCNDACLRLTGKPIPLWVNRLAKLGALCKCVLPVGAGEGKRVAAVEEGEKKKLSTRSAFTSPEDAGGGGGELAITLNKDEQSLMDMMNCMQFKWGFIGGKCLRIKKIEDTGIEILFEKVVHYIDGEDVTFFMGPFCRHGQPCTIE